MKSVWTIQKCPHNLQRNERKPKPYLWSKRNSMPHHNSPFDFEAVLLYLPQQYTETIYSVKMFTINAWFHSVFISTLDRLRECAKSNWQTTALNIHNIDALASVLSASIVHFFCLSHFLLAFSLIHNNATARAASRAAYDRCNGYIDSNDFEKKRKKKTHTAPHSIHMPRVWCVRVIRA